MEAMRRGTRLYLRWWPGRPASARAYLLSLRVAGEGADAQGERTYELFRAMFGDLGRRARAEQPELPPLSPLIPRVLVAAITEIVGEEFRAGRIEQLGRRLDQIAALAISMLADDATPASPVCYSA